MAWNLVGIRQKLDKCPFLDRCPIFVLYFGEMNRYNDMMYRGEPWQSKILADLDDKILRMNEEILN